MYRKRECILHGDKVLLVPYSPHHVKKYHGWMEDAVLRNQTASERLTLEQEHAMQQSWMTSEDKCTFIVLSRDLYEEEHMSEVDSMAGDVNLFLSQEERGGATAEEEEGKVGGKEEEMSRHFERVAEIDIMIAEPECRGKGLGIEATTLMLSYGVQELDIKRFRAKVALDNKASFNLFENKLGFKEVSRSSVFNEVTLELVVADQKTFAGPLKWTEYKPKLVPNET